MCSDLKYLKNEGIAWLSNIKYTKTKFLKKEDKDKNWLWETRQWHQSEKAQRFKVEWTRANQIDRARNASFVHRLL